MDVLRRNTDYGLRMMAAMAKHFNNGGLMSARQLASEGNFSYQLGCKLLQKLHKAKLLKSKMGPKGGFRLSKRPDEISLMEIIEVLQDGICLNNCLSDDKGCEFQSDCPISSKLSCLQLHIDRYLSGITLAELLKPKNKTPKN